MIPEYLTLTAEELLDKFGAGRHKPGSGSAVALLGLLSCNLTKTVISISIGKKEYQDVEDRLKEINLIITETIEPTLSELLQEDSVQFDRVINLRRERDDENNFEIKTELEDKAFEELNTATGIPLKIAKTCLQLADYAIEVFDSGFKAARGDSAVAISSALSTVSGSLSIIYLNLTSFWGTDWAISIIQETDKLNIKLQDNQKELSKRIKKLQTLAMEANAPISLNIDDIRSPEIVGSNPSYEEIERIVKKLQNKIWKKRRHIWRDKEEIPKSRIEALEPQLALAVLGFDFKSEDSLGQIQSENGITEVAGFIDSSKDYVGISTQFPLDIQNFTAAHELGHAFLHESVGLHRDRALDGSTIDSQRDKIEIEADKFATFFLMPKKVVKKIFKNYYRTDSFSLTQDTAFALGYSLKELKSKCSNLRDLSRILASATSYEQKHFVSIAERFRVSKEAMAIRLEELNLLQYQK